MRIYELGQEQMFELVVRDEEVHWACLEVTRRAHAEATARPAIIAIQVDRSFRPCDVGLGNDARDLGVCLQAISITPAAGGEVGLAELAASA